ncbi:hypothetical protein RQP54_03340 [Curvibacter sp. APW13]|uniref:hypothetical protein n=1 Tax=Curvibacter sp. APW13 TaxID=3077236 RepID=UPI0028DE5220|nr:hypothetical protein [Curvibacter sp. APW13]MDT8989889.1 hypothetical protein [Curvibacter sp. APW13]
MNANPSAQLEAIRVHYDRGYALVCGFGLLSLSWALAFFLDDDLCWIAAALCALYCMHVSNAKQAWTDAKTAAHLEIMSPGLLHIYPVQRGQYFECDAEVQLPDGSAWHYPNARWAFPCTEPEPCLCYFKPGIAWPVLITSEQDIVIADHRPSPIQHGQQRLQGHPNAA